MQLLVPQHFQTSENCLSFQEVSIASVYYDSGINNELSFDVFKLALSGMQKSSKVQNKKIITIIDFSKSSSEERFFVIDLVNKKILYKTLVAHGRNSGELIAESFSNEPQSQKSSLGFFVTAETYDGKHGYSLSLDGLEAGINDNARSRSIVIHGADYVSPDFIRKYGRLGRSWGCPALPAEVSKEIIDTISGGSCIFIYADNPDYLQKSIIINGPKTQPLQ
jgi:hypothetical protein